MKIKWLHIVRDVVIVTIMFFIGGGIAGVATGGMPTREAQFVASLLMGAVGFCLCGCLTIENRWKHLLMVALGVWLTNFLPMLFFDPFSVLSLASGILSVLVTMVIGGATSSVLARAPKQKECRVDEPEKGENG